MLADRDAEMDFIAAEMTRLHEAGVPYREQAVLCRSHTVLNRVAAALEAREIPALFLGDLFERPEVRDLLSLIALAAGQTVAASCAWHVSPSTPCRKRTCACCSMRHTQRVSRSRPPSRWRPRRKRSRGCLSPGGGGCNGSQRISRMPCVTAQGYTPCSCGICLTAASISAPCGNRNLTRGQRRLALFQLLEITRAFQRREGGGEGDSLPRLGPYVRSMAIAGEDRRFAQLPLWADPLDAVRLLTVHAAKGLEFSAVFVPEARKGHFPSQGRPDATRARPHPV